MSSEQHRYYIELRPTMHGRVGRAQETDMRRSLALDFIHTLREWLEENGLTTRVTTLDVTMFGQVHITCDPTIIDMVREQDVLNIASIRKVPAFGEPIKRFPPHMRLRCSA